MKIELKEIRLRFQVDNHHEYYPVAYLFNHEMCIAFDDKQVYLHRVHEVLPGIYEETPVTKIIVLGEIMLDDITYEQYAKRIIAKMNNTSMYEFLTKSISTLGWIMLRMIGSLLTCRGDGEVILFPPIKGEINKMGLKEKELLDYLNSLVVDFEEMLKKEEESGHPRDFSRGMLQGRIDSYRHVTEILNKENRDYNFLFRSKK
ncbi:hypothetical protein LCM23_19950 [Cytobacillus kochii]|uniref:hypothetical protein n=1 Tax=Cytobacillus kochii TaxID=859143 RepID=UPI001CD5631D|nr:hypothetical protein [Cytobacillus kochii]MCA1028341.1 hypothetical protein [Cytobacillus kochii]